MPADLRGLPLTATDEAAALFDRAVGEMLEYRLAVAPSVAACLEHDPDFALARVVAAALLLTQGTNAVRPQIEAHVAAAVAARGLTERERRHVAALERWAAGDIVGACAVWQAIVGAWPHDILAVRFLHHQGFWTGNGEMMRTAPACVLPAWSPDMPGYGFLLSMLAFGIEECGDYRTAERLGRQAYALNPADIWSVHAVAHVLEMEGRLDDGRRWLCHPVDHWNDRSAFRTHIWWHAALFMLEQDDHAGVLALYDEAIRPGERCFYIDLHNCASLLARLEFRGVDVGARWETLARHAEAWAEDHVIVFSDIHAAMALARCGRTEYAARQLASLERVAGSSTSYLAATLEPVTLPLIRAIQAFYAGRFGEAVDLLLPLRRIDAQVGGSHAQRDVFRQLALEAALRAGRFDTARHLAAERVVLRPSSAGNWRKYAAALAGLGDGDGAAVAEERAARAAA
ncbi:MAG: tetratricopeptide repeat protein [Geminicoccaceae bacterium]